MSDLNRVIRDERSENAKLRQELQHTQVAEEELQEKSFQLEQLRAEKTSLEDENRRILAKVLRRLVPTPISSLSLSGLPDPPGIES